MIGLRNVLGIALALVPDGTADAVGANRIDHGVELVPRILVTQRGWLGDDRRRESLNLVLHGLSGINLRIVFSQFLRVFLQALGPVALCPWFFVIRGLVRDSARIILLDFPRHPAFDRRTRKSLLNDADGDAELFVQLLAEVVGDRRGLRCRLRIARFPLGQAVARIVQGLVPVFAC